MELNRDDCIRKDVIMKIMCQSIVDFDKISNQWHINFKDYFESEFDQLSEFENDGLVMVSGNCLIITEKGRLFLRNIAMVFDTYLNDALKKNYSKTV